MKYEITAKFTLREMNALVKALEERQGTLQAAVRPDTYDQRDPQVAELGDVTDMIARLKASA